MTTAGFEPAHSKSNCLVGSRVKTTPPNRLILIYTSLNIYFFLDDKFSTC